MGHCFILRQHAGTPVIKGLVADTPPKLVSFWDAPRKTTLSDLITPCAACIPRGGLFQQPWSVAMRLFWFDNNAGTCYFDTRLLLLS